MQNDVLERELARFDPALPLERAWTPPASWYTDADFHACELHSVFGDNWQLAARAEQVARPGAYVSGMLGSDPYVVARGDDGQLRAFHNVCRHHAAAVATGEGCADRFVCPYHGWIYQLDGRLKSAPRLGGVQEFDRESFGLVPMQVAAWGPWVFVTAAENPRDLDADLGPLMAALEGMALDQLHFVRRVEYRLDCNWKVFVDNYLDGGYHVSVAHPGLAGQLDLDSYRNELQERYSIQWCAAGDDTADTGSDFAERIGEEALYAFIHPNLMINRYGPMMDLNLVLPDGPDRCTVLFDYYFRADRASDEAFVARSLAASDVVQQEDIALCDSVQLGLGSRVYDRGRYSVTHESPMLHFHRLLAADLSSGL